MTEVYTREDEQGVGSTWSFLLQGKTPNQLTLSRGYDTSGVPGDEVFFENLSLQISEKDLKLLGLIVLLILILYLVPML